jgi:hypothetical protein
MPRPKRGRREEVMTIVIVYDDDNSNSFCWRVSVGGGRKSHKKIQISDDVDF